MSPRALSRNASITLISWLIALALAGAFAAILRQAESAQEAKASATGVSAMIEERRAEGRELSESIAALRQDLRKAAALRERLGNTRRANFSEVARLESEIARLEAEVARHEAATGPTPQRSAEPRPMMTLCAPSAHQHSPPNCWLHDPNN
jgi:septal ring factor EnvC (AmiA/AmiB activator)